MRSIATLVVALVALVACGPGPQGPTDAGSGPPGKFSDIYAKFFPTTTRAQCNFCHSNPPNDISNGKLSMGSDKDAAYAALVGHVSTSSKCGGKSLVVAGDPEKSLFLDKMKATPSCGGRMPLGGSPLTDADLEQVKSWIENGAKND